MTSFPACTTQTGRTCVSAQCSDSQAPGPAAHGIYWAALTPNPAGESSRGTAMQVGMRPTRLAACDRCPTRPTPKRALSPHWLRWRHSHTVAVVTSLPHVTRSRSCCPVVAVAESRLSAPPLRSAVFSRPQAEVHEFLVCSTLGPGPETAELLPPSIRLRLPAFGRLPLCQPVEHRCAGRSRSVRSRGRVRKPLGG